MFQRFVAVRGGDEFMLPCSFLVLCHDRDRLLIAAINTNLSHINRPKTQAMFKK